MSGVKSDIEIARAAKMQPIKDVLGKLNVPDKPEAFMPMGRYIAKVNLDYIEILEFCYSKILSEVTREKTNEAQKRKEKRSKNFAESNNQTKGEIE